MKASEMVVGTTYVSKHSGARVVMTGPGNGGISNPFAGVAIYGLGEEGPGVYSTSWNADAFEEYTPSKDPIIQGIIKASVGSQAEHDIIQMHMDEYFTKFKSYKKKFSDLEWYHIFLDFMESAELVSYANFKKSLFDKMDENIHNAQAGLFSQTIKDWMNGSNTEGK